MLGLRNPVSGTGFGFRAQTYIGKIIMANVTNLGSNRLIAYTGASNTLQNNVSPFTVITVSHGTATTLTIPESTDVEYGVGTVLFVVQVGAGAVTVAKTGSDTINGTVATAAAGDTLIVTKTTATGWHSGLAT